MSLPLFVRNYFGSTLAYGFVRAATYDYKATTEYKNKKTGRYETKEMLVVDSVGTIASNTLAAVFAWPFMMSEDLAKCECLVRGKDSAEYTSLYHRR